MKVVGSGFYHPELDAFRFVAFLMVFVAHSTYHVPVDWAHLSRPLFVASFSIHGAGFYGVDLFFVLSSYLITELLLREQDKTGSIHLKQFYVRRILRIWPLYFFFLLAITPLLPRVIPGESLPPKVLAAFLLLAGNWSCAWLGWPSSVCAQLWSITVEEQFYVTWPFLLRRWQLSLPWAAVGMLWISNLTRLLQVMYPRNDASIWCNTFARLDPIAGGILLAWWLHGRENWLRGWVRAHLLLGGSCLLLFVGYYGDHTDWRALFSYPLAAVGCVMLVFGTVRPHGDWQPRRIGRAFIYLGQISYGLYVYHVLALVFATQLLPGSIWSAAALAMTFTIFMASVSFYLLERPFLKLKGRFALVRSRDEMLDSVVAGR